MLQNIRDKTQGWKTQLIIGLVCVAFILWGAHSFLQWTGNSNSAIAAVNGKDIMPSEFRATYQRLQQQQQSQLGANFQLTPKMQEALQQATLQQLITSTALTQAAQKRDLRYTPAQVGRVISDISAFQEDGHFSPTKFEQALASLGYSENEFFDNIRDAMLINQLRIGIVGSSFALPWEIKTLIQLVNQKRDIQYLLIPTKSFENKISVSDAELHQYYQTHQEQFTTPQTLTLQYVELSLPDLAKKMVVSEAELKSAYEANNDQYTISTKWQLETVYVPTNDDAALVLANNLAQQLKQGKKLDDIAKANPSIKAQTTNWVSSKEMSSEIVAVLQKMQPGEISAPMHAGQGFIVVKMVNIRPGQKQSFEQVKNSLRDAVQQQKASQAFADAVDKLNNLTYTNPQSLAPAAKALGLTLNTSDPITPKSQDKGVFANDAVKQAAFSKDVLAGNNSNLINLDDQHALVLRILSQEPSHTKSFEEVKSDIAGLLRAQKLQEAASTAAQNMVTEVMNGKTLASVAAVQHLSLVSQKNIGRYISGSNAAIYNAAFQLPRPNKQASVGMFRLPSGDFVVIQVTAVHGSDDQHLQPIQQRVIEQQIASSYAQLDYQLYVNGVLSDSKIRVYAGAKNA